jgi:hypothetical protein
LQPLIYLDLLSYYYYTTTNITTQQSLLTVLIYVPSPLSFVPAANNWCSFVCFFSISSYPSAFQLMIITHHYLTVKLRNLRA